MRLRTALILSAVLGAANTAWSADDVAPVRQLVVFVPPFYEAAPSAAEAPKVAVDPDWNALLASTSAANIRRARDGIAAHPDLVKPETLMTLAIRLYDTGLRDDAVFWFYAGRERFLTMQAVLDMRSLRLARSAQTVESFVDAVGPLIEDYAWCDVDHHQEREDRAIAWVAAHPYKLLGYSDLPAQSEDRNASLTLAVTKLREASAHNAELIADPVLRKQLAEQRKKVHADERFCWK